MSPVIDFSNVQDQEFETMPRGVYPARLDSWETKEGKAGLYYSLTFVLTEDAGEFKNRKLWVNRSLSEKALSFFKRDMIRLGTPPEDFNGALDTDDIVAACVGADCRLRVDVESYTPNSPEYDDNGNAIKKDRNTVSEVLASTFQF